MASPLTLRLDKKTRDRIASIARRKRVSSSEVIREAIASWVARHEGTDTPPYESIEDLVGIVHGGDPGRSTQTGRRFGELLKARRRRS